MKEAADNLAQTIERVDELVEIDQITTFIVSPEVENTLKQVFCASVLPMQSTSLSQRLLRRASRRLASPKAKPVLGSITCGELSAFVCAAALTNGQI